MQFFLRFHSREIACVQHSPPGGAATHDDNRIVGGCNEAVKVRIQTQSKCKKIPKKNYEITIIHQGTEHTHRARGKETLPRLRMPYIGGLSSSIRTIESQPGSGVDALSDTKIIDAALLRACVPGGTETSTERIGDWIPE